MISRPAQRLAFQNTCATALQAVRSGSGQVRESSNSFLLVISGGGLPPRADPPPTSAPGAPEVR
eukprot:8063753-Alexandrium_andersonii.AAC.1